MLKLAYSFSMKEQLFGQIYNRDNFKYIVWISDLQTWIIFKREDKNISDFKNISLGLH